MNSRQYCPEETAGRKREKARKRLKMGLAVNDTIFGKRPFLTVKISLERGCFWEGRGGGITGLLCMVDLGDIIRRGVRKCLKVNLLSRKI